MEYPFSVLLSPVRVREPEVFRNEFAADWIIGDHFLFVLPFPDVDKNVGVTVGFCGFRMGG
jgi:hypothetical protein